MAPQRGGNRMIRFEGFKYRTKLLFFFLLATVVILLAFIYTFFSQQILIKETTDMFDKNMELTSVYRELSSIQHEMEIYLSTSNSDNLLSFYDHMNKIRSNADKLLSNVSYTAKGIRSMNAAEMIINYLDEAEQAIYAKRGRNIDEYTAYYDKTVKDNKYIVQYIEEIMTSELIDSSDLYVAISNRINFATTFNNMLILVVVIFITIMIIIFSFQITKPITRLASYARKVSSGDFEVEVPQVKGGEIGLLYNTFDLMLVNIRSYIREIQEKARLELSLNEQRMNNLKMKNTLRETELLALQSQINPHFIFNTINIGAKIAMLQGDQTTCTYLEHTADIFRYNLRGFDSLVELKEEIDNVCSYVYLLQTRFGDHVGFELSLGDDETALCTIVPRMMLQPIVENAYIHGISEMESGGRIRLQVESDAEFVWVSVNDNGKGISEEKIRELLTDKSDEDMHLAIGTKQGHTTGIGIDNVVKRLRLYYGMQDAINITSIDAGTRVIFKLPRRREAGEDNVQSVNS